MTDILQGQIEYYRQRAGEYDEWFYRKGRYDQGEELNAVWFDETDIVRTALYRRQPVTSALELACGTGIWTQELVKIADHVTALDASPEMIAVNQAKLGADAETVTYTQTDLFQWEPDQHYDLVFFGFWLSHAPPEKLDGFLANVRRALRPDGHVFMIDGRADPTSTAHNQHLPEAGSIIQRRILNDGREYDIVKIYYDADDLRRHFVRAGLKPDVRVTNRYYIYVDATR
jgi:demethylmenaquinone methyltransferase/2-methoxy-6-polyprenyl-1,4-benzoquinol methylase